MAESFDGLLDALREAAQQARRQLNEDIDIAGLVERAVTVKIEGASDITEYTEIEYTHSGTLTEFDDGMTEQEIDEILSLVTKLEQMRDNGELMETLPMLRRLAALPIAEVAAEIVTEHASVPEPKARLAWPGTGGGIDIRTTDAQNYPRDYEPPSGYDWTGEFRVPGGSEPWVTTSGDIGHNNSNASVLGGRRLILRKLAEGETPSYVHPAAAPATAAENTAPSGAFQPPSEPTPV